MEFKPMPKRGEVHSGSPDGLYLQEDGDDKKQVIIVGPMMVSPGEIEDQFDDFEIVHVFALSPIGGSPDNPKPLLDDMRRTILRRGFIGVVLHRMPPDERKPENYIAVASEEVATNVQ